MCSQIWVFLHLFIQGRLFTFLFLVVMVCNHGDVQLVGGNTDYEGRVEVCINGYWGHICDDGWNTAKAMVVCKQLFGENISKSTMLTARMSCPSINVSSHIQWYLHFLLVHLVVVLGGSCCTTLPVMDHHQD